MYFIVHAAFVRIKLMMMMMMMMMIGVATGGGVHEMQVHSAPPELEYQAYFLCVRA